MVSKTINKAIKDVRDIFNRHRSNLSHKKQRESETNFIKRNYL